MFLSVWFYGSCLCLGDFGPKLGSDVCGSKDDFSGFTPGGSGQQEIDPALGVSYLHTSNYLFGELRVDPTDLELAPL